MAKTTFAPIEINRPGFEIYSIRYTKQQLKKAMIVRYETDKIAIPGPLSIASNSGIITNQEFNDALASKDFEAYQEQFLVILLMELGIDI